MAGIAGDAAASVVGALNIGFVEAVFVASEASFHGLFGWHEGKGAGNGGFAATRLHMSLSGPVAAFASGLFGRFFARNEAFIVRILEKELPDVGMASLTGIAADISRWISRRRCRSLALRHHSDNREEQKRGNRASHIWHDIGPRLLKFGVM